MRKRFTIAQQKAWHKLVEELDVIASVRKAIGEENFKTYEFITGTHTSNVNNLTGELFGYKLADTVTFQSFVYELDSQFNISGRIPSKLLYFMLNNFKSVHNFDGSDVDDLDEIIIEYLF